MLLFLIFFGACCAAAATGALFPPGDWYKRLNKPDWTPPDWLFPVAWTTIYICISIAGAIVAGQEGAGYALAFWALQAGLSTLWTPIFFGLRRLQGSLYCMGPLWIAVAGCTITHFQVSLLAGLLFLPYLVWVTIAAALNYTVAQMNPDEPPLKLDQI